MRLPVLFRREKQVTLEQVAQRVSVQLAPLKGTRLMIALSGGADSVALTLALCRLRACEGWELRAAHVNHGLRGAESDGDEAFVRILCAAQHLPLTCVRLTPPTGAGETWAREERYAALLAAAQQEGCGAVVLAHHQDDQTETLLEHLLRGCGPEGLAGMRPISTRAGMTLVRPLLGISRQALRETLRDANASWREDATNGEANCLRNRLRLEVLPMLEALAPGAGARMAQATRLQGAEQQMLADMEAAFLQAQDHGWDALPLAALRTLHPVMQGRVLRRWWAELPGDLPRLDERQTEAWRALITGKVGSRCNLPGDWHGERGYRFLHRTPPTREMRKETRLPQLGTYWQQDRLRLTVAPWQPSDGHGDGKRVQVIPAALVQACTLRTRQTGDWLRSFGGGGRKAVQDVLTDRKVDGALRDRVPMLCREKEVLWIAGVTAGNLPHADEKEKLWTLRWSGCMPWLDGQA